MASLRGGFCILVVMSLLLPVVPITLGIRIGNTYFQTKQDSNRTKPRGVLVLYRYYACIRPRTRETICFILEKLFVERVFIVILKENIFDWNLFAAIICLVSCPICAPELGDMSRAIFRFIKLPHLRHIKMSKGNKLKLISRWYGRRTLESALNYFVFVFRSKFCKKKFSNKYCAFCTFYLFDM